MTSRSPSPVARLLGAGAAALITLSVLTAVGLSVTPANAATLTFSQCNGFMSGGVGGATTQLECDIEIINTINGPNRSAVLTVRRSCTGGVNNACPAGANTGAGNTGTVTTTFSGDVITSVNQCNGSANQAAITTPPIACNVRITNNISADQIGTLGLATLNQCNGSDGTANNVPCDPDTATTSNATVTQCNVSGEGGGGTVDCFFELNNDMTSPVSKVSSALPISINQCNGTGNPGGSYVTCDSFITTNITAAFVPTGGTTAGGTTAGGSTAGGSTAGGTTTGGTTTGGTTTGGTTTGGTTTGGTTTGGTGSSGTSGGQVTTIPRGGVAVGGGSTSGLQHPALLAIGVLLLTGAGLLLHHRFGRRAS